MPEVAAGAARKAPSPAALADARQQSNRWQTHWIKRWDLKRPLDEAQIRAIKEALAHGHPVACGLRWPKVLKGPELIEVPPPGAVEDGHSIALVGYTDGAKDNGGAFIFRNSWGPKWGNGGYGTLSYAYVRAYANNVLWLELGPPNSEVPAEQVRGRGGARGRDWPLQVQRPGHGPMGKGHVDPGQAALLQRGERGLRGVGPGGPQAGHLSTPRAGHRGPRLRHDPHGSRWKMAGIRNSTCIAAVSRRPGPWSWATSRFQAGRHRIRFEQRGEEPGLRRLFLRHRRHRPADCLTVTPIIPDYLFVAGCVERTQREMVGYAWSQTSVNTSLQLRRGSAQRTIGQGFACSIHRAWIIRVIRFSRGWSDPFLRTALSGHRRGTA